jgi:hypothetical protein
MPPAYGILAAGGKGTGSAARNGVIAGKRPADRGDLDLPAQMREWNAMTASTRSRAICICGIIITG